jgi:hypothetical protein
MAVISREIIAQQVERIKKSKDYLAHVAAMKSEVPSDDLAELEKRIDLQIEEKHIQTKKDQPPKD